MTIQEKLQAAAARYGVPESLVLRMAAAESSYSQAARSPKGAIGVMQLMPGTARDLGVNPYDEDQNIDGGVRYLAQLYRRFGSWETAAAAYNAGPGRIADVLAGFATVPAETYNYIVKLFGAGPSFSPAPASSSNASSSNQPAPGWSFPSFTWPDMNEDEHTMLLGAGAMIVAGASAWLFLRG